MMCVLQSLEPRRLFAGGQIDATFGTAGSTDLSFGATRLDQIYTPQLSADSGGQVYALARVTHRSSKSFRVQRLRPDGRVDTAWASANGGVLSYPETLDSNGATFAVDAQDRLIVGVGNQLFRYNAGGTPDRTFGRRGTLTLSAFQRVADVQIDRTGRLYVSATTAAVDDTRLGQAALIRLNADGGVDRTFGVNGAYTLPAYVPKKLTQPGSDGVESRLLADGTIAFITTAQYGRIAERYTGFASVRLTSRGRAVAGYGEAGVVRAYVDAYSHKTKDLKAIHIRPDGSVLLLRKVAGSIYDTTFNDVLSADGDRRTAVSLAARGKLAPDEFATFIDQPDGSTLVASDGFYRDTKRDVPDATFHNGRAVDGVYAAAVQPDGTVVVIGPRPDYQVRSLVARRVFVDDAPVATFAAKRLTTAGRSATFTLTVRDADGIAASSITSSALRVFAPDGTQIRPRLFETVALDDGSVQAVYRAAGPGGDPFTAAGNGVYAVRVVAGQIKDTTGTALATRTVGSFRVAIA